MDLRHCLFRIKGSFNIYDFGSTGNQASELISIPGRQASVMEIGKYKIRVNAITRGLNLEDEFSLSVGRERAEKLMNKAAPLERWLNVKNDLTSRITKKEMKGMSISGMNYYACLSILSLSLLTHFAIVVEGPKMWAAGWQTAMSQIGPNFVW
ncbi:hypothetical protein P8452_03362 [Trifolium repens]|nr:hypothetical protein P8452_03362 [Trifolium repens]